MIETRLPLTIIAAVARNRVIGHGGRMPWTLPGDMAHFRAATLGRPVLMGRRTYDAIGGALPGRPNVVVSRDPTFSPKDVTVVRDLDDALQQADAIGLLQKASEIMVAGGGRLYHALIGTTTTLLLTEVDLDPAGDTVFPVVDPVHWCEVERISAPQAAGDSARFAFVRYRRRP